MKKYYMSRYQYPTHTVMNGDRGYLDIGHKRARAALEAALKGRFVPEPLVWKQAGNWVFEGRITPNEERT